MTVVGASGRMRVALVGPREEPFLGDPDLEHRETMLRSYEEICDGIAAFGSDYTVSREFLGIEYLAATLRDEGHLVRVISASNEGLSEEALLVDLLAFEPQVVGLSVLYDLQLANAIILSRRLKDARPDITIVFGGPLASAIAELLLKTFPFVDFVIEGEGERALAQLVEALERGANFDGIPALAHRSEGGVVRNPRGEPLDLDSLPHPSRDVIASIRARNLPVSSAYMITSRGCKAFCTFCTVPNIVRGMKAGVYRMRDPVDVVDEMEAIVRDNGVTRFYMADDNFLGYGEESNRRMLALADEILRRRLKINFHAECRVDSLVPETLVRLRDAGFDQILFGLESGSQRTLKRWGKGQTVAQNEAAVALARRLGLDLMPSIILLDWESDLAELEDTVAFIERNQLYRSGQPLWLVNKLKVHCGTAAARRYDNVHGKPIPPAITDDASIRRWCAIVTYQGVRIDNPHVAAFWSALNSPANRWSLLLDEVIPEFLKSLRRKSRNGDKTKHIELVRCIASFRRSIGSILVELMRVLIDHAAVLERSGVASPPSWDFVADFVDARERYFFADGLDNALRDHGRRRWIGIADSGRAAAPARPQAST